MVAPLAALNGDSMLKCPYLGRRASSLSREKEVFNEKASPRPLSLLGYPSSALTSTDDAIPIAR